MPPAVLFYQAEYRRRKALICPGINGATNWFSPSYNPNTGLFYVMALENCNLFFASRSRLLQGETYYGHRYEASPRRTLSRRFCWRSPWRTGKTVWRYPQSGGATPGEGRSQPRVDSCSLPTMPSSLEAVEAATGRALWHFNTGQTFSASPMTYAVDGVQYVAISAGSDVFSFALPH